MVVLVDIWGLRWSWGDFSLQERRKGFWVPPLFGVFLRAGDFLFSVLLFGYRGCDSTTRAQLKMQSITRDAMYGTHGVSLLYKSQDCTNMKARPNEVAHLFVVILPIVPIY